MARPFPSALDPQAYQRIVGATFAKAEHRTVITIGNKTWSRYELGRLGCPHPAAASRVAQLLARLGIRTRDEFLDRAHEFGGFKSIGVTCYWVVLALARDLGADIETVHDSDRSFAVIHRHALHRKPTRRNK